MSPVTLLTGASGFLGLEVLARLLERGEGEVRTLIRGDDQAAADARLAAALDGLGVAGESRRRVRAVRGELTAAGLGLEDGEADRLAAEVTEVVHCAASVSFSLGLEEARAINVVGTGRVLDLARHIDQAGHLERLVHVSTAFVAGRHSGRFTERDLFVDQEFRNTYERTKAEGEALVSGSASELPTVVVRPSIVVGESDSGWTPVFNVLYWPLRAFERGLLPAVPARPDARVDVVPADYVADAVVHLLRERPDVRGVVHATAGDGAITAERLLALACDAFGREMPEFVEATPELAERSEEAGRYLPYFDMDVIFDDARAREVLGPAGLRAPALEDYFPAIADFAQRARWGKRPLTRAQAREGLPTAA